MAKFVVVVVVAVKMAAMVFILTVMPMVAATLKVKN